jgi:hypothetical protein
MTSVNSFLLGVIFTATIFGVYIERREDAFEQRIAQARIEAARQIMRVNQCGWKDLFVVQK